MWVHDVIQFKFVSCYYYKVAIGDIAALFFLQFSPNSYMHRCRRYHIFAAEMHSKSQEVIYSTDEYLAEASSYFPPLVLLELLKRILDDNKKSIDQQLTLFSQEIISGNTLRVSVIEPFVKRKLIQHNYAQKLYRDLPCETGLRIYFIGDIQNSFFIFHIIDRFFRKHPLQIHELTPVQHYMVNKFCSKQAMVFPWLHHFFMIKYTPNCSKKFMNAMTQAQFGIGRNQIQHMPNGNSYDTLAAFWEVFCRYIRSKNIRVNYLRINQNYISYHSDTENDVRFKDALQQFLTHFSLTLNPVNIFADEFEASIFMRYYAKELREIKLVEDAARGGIIGKIASINYLCDQDTVEHNIEQLYQKMLKNYKFIPSLTRPTVRSIMRPLDRPSMLSLCSLRQKIHIINDKFKIVVRSFGSIHQNEDVVMFLVHQLERCAEFRAILAENHISEGSFKDWIRGERGERYLEYLTENSRFTNSALAWYINMVAKNKDRVVRDLEYFFNVRFREVMTIKIMIPAFSKELIQFFFPIFMQKLLELTKFCESGLIKTVQFIASCTEQDRIRLTLWEGISTLAKSRNIKLQTFNPLQLSLFSVQKMAELRYFTVEYCLRGNKQIVALDGLGGTVFVYEALKTGIVRRIIIALRQDPTSVELILNVYFQKIYSLGPQGIRQECWREMGQKMMQIVNIVRKFCPNMDILVLYGSASLKEVESELYFCQIKEGDRLVSMTKMEINFQEEKISLNREKIYDLRYRVNQDKERFLVETHSDCADQVRKMLKSTILSI